MNSRRIVCDHHTAPTTDCPTLTQPASLRAGQIKLALSQLQKGEGAKIQASASIDERTFAWEAGVVRPRLDDDPGVVDLSLASDSSAPLKSTKAVET